MKIKDFEFLEVVMTDIESFNGENFTNNGSGTMISLNNKYGLESILFSFLNNKFNIANFNNTFKCSININTEIKDLTETFEIKVNLLSLPFKDPIIIFNVDNKRGKIFNHKIDNIHNYIFKLVEMTETNKNRIEHLENEINRTFLIKF